MSEPGYAQTITEARQRGLLIVAACALPPALVIGLVLAFAVQWLAGVLAFVVLGGVLAAWLWYAGERQARRLLGGSPADPLVHARLFNLVEGLCPAIGVPAPELRVVADQALNAASAGRDPHSAVLVVTSGLLEELTRIELEGVVAHELVRIKNLEILPATLAVPASGPGAVAVRRAANASGPAAWWWTACAAPFVPPRVLMGGLVSSREEAVRDRLAVSVTRYPPGLLGALEKLRDRGTMTRSTSPAVAHLWLADPLPPVPVGRWPARYFGDRLPLVERIEALSEL